MYLVNSPVVRAEVLKFKEEGVRDVVSRVLLPWLNSFRFFLGQAALFQKDYGEGFQYDAHAKQSDNVMDRWILARCQSLIKLVREEMAGTDGVCNLDSHDLTVFFLGSVPVIHHHWKIIRAHRRDNELVHSV